MSRKYDMIEKQQPSEISSPSSLLEDGARILTIGFLSITCLLFLVYAIAALLNPYTLDYGEAPLVDEALNVMRGLNIYRPNLDTPPYTVTNYPPLYIFTLVPFQAIFGPNLWGGRLISILAGLASAIFIALITKTYTQDKLASIISGMIFLSMPYVVYWSALARIDLLALALSMAGLYLLVRWPEKRWSFLTGGLLLFLAIFTRQSYALAAPLAAFIWLLTRSWKKALWLAVYVGGLTVGIYLLLNILTHGGFFFNIITATNNEFGMERLQYNLKRFREIYPILIGVGGLSILLIAFRRRSSNGYIRWSLTIPYLIGAVVSALTIGKIGSNVNYFLELCAALSLAAGVVIAWTGKRQWLRAILFLLLVWQAGILLKTTLHDYVTDLQHRWDGANELRKLDELVAKTEGPILADEHMDMVTIQGRLLYFQPFQLTQLARQGVWDQTPLLESIRNKEFPLILIHYFPDYPVYKERWTPEMLDAIDRSYLPTDMYADTRVYGPKGSRTLKLACAGAPWQLPSNADYGLQWNEASLDFFGLGNAGAVPVYAVADGLLTRLAEMNSSVAILHEDPFQTGGKVWSFYTDMQNVDGTISYIASDFPPGSENVPVKKGQLLGNQGNWSGNVLQRAWVHLRFAAVKPGEDGSFPYGNWQANAFSPAAYFGVTLSEGQKDLHLQDLTCGTQALP